MIGFAFYFILGGNLVEDLCDVQAATICMYDCPNTTCYTPLQGKICTVLHRYKVKFALRQK